MSVEVSLISIGTQPATADLSGKLFCAVFFDTSGGVSVAASTKNADGILQNNPTLGGATDVAILGISKAVVSATVTAGQLLQVDATGNGSLIPVAGGTVVAKAMEGSGTISSGVAVIAVLILKSNALYA